MKRRGLVGWFRWLRRGLTPCLGTIYRIRAYRPDGSGQLMHRAYFGQTRQVPWTKRIEGHLWGTDDTRPQPWADTVPGWRPNGTVEEVIVARGATVVCRFQTVLAILTALEILTIRYGLPVYNDQHNRGNPRRIPKWLRSSAAADGGRCSTSSGRRRRRTDRCDPRPPRTAAAAVDGAPKVIVPLKVAILGRRGRRPLPRGVGSDVQPHHALRSSAAADGGRCVPQPRPARPVHHVAILGRRGRRPLRRPRT